MKIDKLVTMPTSGPSSIPVSQIVTFEEIGIDGHELIMRPVNRTYVKRLAKSLGNWPDIECIHIQWQGKERFLLIDGRHRLEAAKTLKLENIRIFIRSYERKEDIVEHAMTANMHHGLSLQKSKLTEHVIWLHFNEYKSDQIASITELTEKEVRHIISMYQAAGENDGDSNIAMQKSDGQLLLEYVTRLRKKVSNRPGDVLHEMVEAIKDTGKQDEYKASISFMVDVFRNVNVG